MAIYVMGDIHGNGNKFFRMLKEINFSKKDILYILGDVLDRGEDSFKIYDYIMENKNIILLLGNHEVALLNVNRCFEKGKWDELEMWKRYWFEGNGEKTYKLFFEEWDILQREKYISFLKHCPIDACVKVGRKYHYMVHSCLSNDVFEKVQNRILMDEVEKNNYDILIREKDIGLYEIGIGKLLKEEKEKAKNDNWIVNPYVWHGHTPTTLKQKGIPRMQKGNRIRNIDCGCNGYTNFGRLCCVRLSDEKEYYL